MDNWNDGIAVYAALEDLGELTVRIYVPYNVEPETPIDQIAEAAELKRRYQGDFVRAGAVKVFMDGVLESYTALMVDDYAGQPGNRGGALHTAERFDAIAAAKPTGWACRFSSTPAATARCGARSTATPTPSASTAAATAATASSTSR
jgi:predicted amidohydrolase YtcJ